MSMFIEELTVEQWEEGELVVKELKKHVLTRGAWSTIMYLYQERDRKTGEFKAPAARVVRYRKLKGQFRPQSKLNISNSKQALEIAAMLQEWFGEQS